MEVKELLALLKNYNRKRDWWMTQLILYEDGTGCIRDYHTQEKIRSFHSISELSFFFTKGEEQKPPDYKSLFSVVGGVLRADFSKIDITEENAWLLSIVKWDFIFEWTNEHLSMLASEGGTGTCALCKLYRMGNCGGCKADCNDSPYGDYIRAKTLYDSMSAAKGMARHLKSLMEKK